MSYLSLTDGTSRTHSPSLKIHMEAKDLEKRVAALKSKESQKTQEEVNLVKSQLDAVIVNFEQQLSRSSPDQYTAILRQSDATISSIVNAHTSASDVQEKSLDPTSPAPQVGDLVQVNSLGGKSATLVDFVDQGDLLIQYGKMRARVKRSDVRVSPGSSNQVRSLSPRFIIFIMRCRNEKANGQH